MKTSKKTKFSLEKMEIAQLKNMRAIKGGQGINGPIDLPTVTDTSKNCNPPPDRPI